MDLRQTIVDWNLRYPYDRRWREKHNIPFMSSRHREMSLVDILAEDIEDKLYFEAKKEYLDKKKTEEEKVVLSLREQDYTPGRANYLRPQEDNMSEEEIDDMFNKIKV